MRFGKSKVRFDPDTYYAMGAYSKIQTWSGLIP